MTKQHLKALNTPRTWNVARHATTFVTRPTGAHPFEFGVSLNHVLKHELSLVSTSKEVQQIINNKACLVNGKVAKDYHLIVGFMDVISFPEIKQNYRVTLTARGKLSLIEIDEKEATKKLSKVTAKYLAKKGVFTLSTLDGRTVKGDSVPGSTLLMTVPDQKVEKTFNLEKGNTIMLLSGKHIGTIGTVEDVTDKNVFFKSSIDDQSYETLKEYAFVIGDKTAAVTVRKD